MPSSVLLAIMVGAGVLALIPALVRRYDKAVRGQAELSSSSMRVLVRRRRQRTVPGAVPVQLPVGVPATQGEDVPRRVRVSRGTVAGAPVSAVPAGAGAAPVSAVPASSPVARRPVGAVAPVSAVPVSAVPVGRPVTVPVPSPRWVQLRRRRVLVAFAALIVVETVGVFAGAPGFVASLAVSALVAAVYVGRLRTSAVAEQRRRRAERRRQVAARARQHRAESFVRRAVRDSRPELETWLGDSALETAATWLALPRNRRRRPARDVVRVLSAAGREAVRAGDGSWTVRTVQRPTAPRQRPAAYRPAPAATLPKVANG